MSTPSAAAASSVSSLDPLTSSDVALLVSSRGAAYTAYAAQFEKDGIDGTVLQSATIDELCDVMAAMNVSVVHKIALKAAMLKWKEQPVDGCSSAATDAGCCCCRHRRQLRACERSPLAHTRSN